MGVDKFYCKMVHEWLSFGMFFHWEHALRKNMIDKGLINEDITAVTAVDWFFDCGEFRWGWKGCRVHQVQGPKGQVH